MEPTGLAIRLLRDGDFVAKYNDSSFSRMRVPLVEVQRLFSWDVLNHCLSCNRITNDRFRLSTEAEHDALNKRAFRPVKDRFGRRTEQLIISELHCLMRQGVTAVLEAVNELAPEVESLTETLGGAFGARSTANAYISFGSTSGFGRHNDDHDVLVVQIDGRKKWQFFGSAVGDGKARVAEVPDAALLTVGDEIMVAGGDVMYIPKGTWHDVISVDERSLHLTVSLVYPTVADFVTWGMQKSRYDAPYLDIRPSDGSFASLRDRCSEFMTELITDRNIDKFVSFYRAGHASSRIKADFPLLGWPTREARYRRIPIEAVPIEQREGRIVTYALGRTHDLSLEECALLQALPHVGGVSGADLAPTEQEWSAAAPLLRSLLDKGLAGKVSRAECFQGGGVTNA